MKALLRPNAELRGLAGVEFKRVAGDVGDRELLKREMEGCDWCFHVAASYHLWLRDYAPMYATNVEGTRNVIEAAAAAGCARIVYTSTVGCIGLPRIRERENRSDGRNGRRFRSADGESLQALEMAGGMRGDGLAKKGLPVIIVNPSAPVGPRDVKPTPTGQIIVDFLNRKMPAYIDSGLNWVHVRDVAVGHILAAEKGRLGERYILGNAGGNWTMEETFDALAEISGVRAPKMKMPHWVALAAGHVSEGMACVTGKPPRVPLAGVRMAKYKMWFNPAKAIRELGLPQTPVKQALAEAVAWFRANGYAKK